MTEMTGFRSANVETYKAAATRRGLRLSDWLREAADLRAEAEGLPVASPEGVYALVTPGGEIVAVVKKQLQRIA